MNTKLIWVILALLVGGAVGYYFGYDHGFEKAAGAEEETLSEHAEPGDRRIEAAETALAGRWRSDDDAKFVREFRADGTVTDTYEGEDPSPHGGVWAVFTEDTPDTEFTGTFEAEATYLAIRSEGEVFFYKIISATPEKLELAYLDRGGVLSFTKL